MQNKICGEFAKLSTILVSKHFLYFMKLMSNTLTHLTVIIVDYFQKL